MDAASPGHTQHIAPKTAQGDTVTRGLQQMFAAIADEPIPDDFLRLLDEIDERVNNKPSGGTA